METKLNISDLKNWSNISQFTTVKTPNKKSYIAVQNIFS